MQSLHRRQMELVPPISESLKSNANGSLNRKLKRPSGGRTDHFRMRFTNDNKWPQWWWRAGRIAACCPLWVTFSISVVGHLRACPSMSLLKMPVPLIFGGFVSHLTHGSLWNARNMTTIGSDVVSGLTIVKQPDTHADRPRNSVCRNRPHLCLSTVWASTSLYSFPTIFRPDPCVLPIQISLYQTTRYH